MHICPECGEECNCWQGELAEYIEMAEIDEMQELVDQGAIGCEHCDPEDVKWEGR